MGLKVRRVVTGHDAHGRAMVVKDAVAENIVRKRPGYESCVIWATETFPADNDDPTDGATRNVPTSVPNGIAPERLVLTDWGREFGFKIDAEVPLLGASYPTRVAFEELLSDKFTAISPALI